jgi:hypothetical protein
MSAPRWLPTAFSSRLDYVHCGSVSTAALAAQTYSILDGVLCLRWLRQFSAVAFGGLPSLFSEWPYVRNSRLNERVAHVSSVKRWSRPSYAAMCLLRIDFRGRAFLDLMHTDRGFDRSG